MDSAIERFNRLDPSRRINIDLAPHKLPGGEVKVFLSVDKNGINGGVLFQRSVTVVGISIVSIDESLAADDRPGKRRRPDQLAALYKLLGTAYLKCKNQ